MAVGAILGSVLQSALAATNPPSKFKQFQQEFQQLGNDLKSGNLGQAQSDLERLEHNSPFLRAGTAASTSSPAGAGVSASNNPIAGIHPIGAGLEGWKSGGVPAGLFHDSAGFP